MENTGLDRRSKYSQKMIRTALFELLEENELDGVTVSAICRIADVNRGTFYKYYKDVRDLFSQIEESFFEEIKAIIERNCTGNFTISTMIGEALEALSKNQDLVQVIQRNNNNSNGVQRILILAKSKMKEISPEITEEEAEYKFTYILGGASHVIVKWISDGMTYPVKRLQEQLVNLMQTDLQNAWQ